MNLITYKITNNDNKLGIRGSFEKNIHNQNWKTRTISGWFAGFTGKVIAIFLEKSSRRPA